MVWRSAALFSVLLLIIFTPSSPARGQSSPYAPGVLTVIPPDPQYEETFSGPSELVEVVKGLPTLDWKPNFTAKSQTVFERSKLTTLRRVIWNLEFSFKPLRMVLVDVPRPDVKMERKRIWYLVYRVRYLGHDLSPSPQTDKWGHNTFQAQPVSHQGQFFFPQFLLVGHQVNKTYQDRIIPAARKPIEQRERHGQRLLNSVEISRTAIPLSTPDAPKEVWGLATWEDIDPRIDFLSIFVGGLTNAYKPVSLPDGYKQGDPPGTGQQLLSKALQLNFWRPGDDRHEHEDEIRFGVPYEEDPLRQIEILSKYGLKQRLDHLWVYR